MSEKLQKFMQLTKVDVAKNLIYGIFTAEQPDKTNEVADYDSTKAAFKAWSDDVVKASAGKSLGNVRKMHTHEVAGRVMEIVYDDVAKVVSGCVEVKPEITEEANKGYLNGFSIGGSYAKKAPCSVFKGKIRFTPIISELSVVDNPCVPDAVFSVIKDATFQVVRADGTAELRKFTPKDEQPKQVWKAADGTDCETLEAALAKNAEIKAAAAAAPITAVLDNLGKSQADKDAEAATAAKAAKAEKLKKAMQHVAQMAHLTDAMHNLAQSHGNHEGEDHPISQKLGKHAKQMSSTLHAMAGHEAENMQDCYDAGKAAGLSENDLAMINKHAANVDLKKAVAADAEPAADLSKLNEVTAERDALQKALAALPEQIEKKFAAAVAAATEPLTKRLAVLEAQPLPDQVRLRTVIKGEEEEPEASVRKEAPTLHVGGSVGDFQRILSR